MTLLPIPELKLDNYKAQNPICTSNCDLLSLKIAARVQNYIVTRKVFFEEKYLKTFSNAISKKRRNEFFESFCKIVVVSVSLIILRSKKREYSLATVVILIGGYI